MIVAVKKQVKEEVVELAVVGKKLVKVVIVRNLRRKAVLRKKLEVQRRKMEVVVKKVEEVQKKVVGRRKEAARRQNMHHVDHVDHAVFLQFRLKKRERVRVCRCFGVLLKNMCYN